MKPTNFLLEPLFFAFESEDKLVKESSRRYYGLNGPWKFNWVKDPRKRPLSFQHISWYGKGSGECYSDRKTGLQTGIYSGHSNAEFERYSRPQETGNKTDIRWVQIKSEKLTLTARRDKGYLNSSIWPFDMKELDFNQEDAGASASGLVPVTKRHGADIRIGDRYQWNIDLCQMGVGGDTS